ncbi:DUF6519 domain-containing protein [Archangium lansingense]|uniref:DUF6519 domain-containing protein n=1 Tax=Archangium lansingense TaxID=2995310 RepID=A0ABT4ABU9_9BACT|nr:DUF6519 domain-containing protein [Archangium lansinium]MCY1078709.1 DUF6519 domain-containing protein [Archangium lansinium]
MGSDRARNTYDAQQRYRSVVAQQGRVVIEADLNEAQELAAEEQRAEALDFVGPQGTPDDGYAVRFDDVPVSKLPLNFRVSPGTMYVGGLRVTRPDTLPPFDTTFWGQQHTEWVDGPVFEPPGDSVSRELIYLHLSEREVSAVEDEALREVALGGPDTSQRTRLTQHIVRLAVSENTTTCQEALNQARQQWENQGLGFDPDTMRLMPTAQLEVGLVPPEPGGDSACEPAAQAGYLGAENQLIRVQVSTAGKLLWGYDNGSQLYRVDLFDKGRKVKLRTPPVDDFHFPREGQIVEVLRAAVRLDNGQHTAAPTGLTFKLGAEPYEPNERLLTLSTDALPDVYQDADSTPALFVRIWEDELDPGFEAPVLLGQTGLRVRTVEGLLVAGDYWMFAVRPSTPQQLYPARYLEGPQFPDGPRQWACPLALVEWDDGEGKLLADCRPPFDNLVELTARVKALEERPAGGGCCKVTVTPEVLAQTRLQEIIDKIAEENGEAPFTVCFQPGLYPLQEPLRIDSRHNGLTLEGCKGAVLTLEESRRNRFLDGLIVLEQASRITLRGLGFRLVPVPFTDAEGATLASLSFAELQSRADDKLILFLKGLAVGIGLRLVRVSQVTVEGCRFDASAFVQGPSFSAGIFANDTCIGLEVRDNQFLATETPAPQGQEWQRMSFGFLHTPSTVFQPATPPQTPLTRETKIRGALAPPRLDEALFRDNQFSNLSAAIFIQADPGSVRLESNEVRNGYAGFWLMTLHASAYAGVTDPSEVNLRRPLDDLRELLPNSDMLVFISGSPPAFGEFYEAGLALLTDPLVLVASTLARGYPLPARSRGLLQLVDSALAGSDLNLNSVRNLSLLAAQAVSWMPQVPDIPFTTAGDFKDQEPRFGPLHRILAALEQQTSPDRPQQASIHVSDNTVETGRDSAPLSTAALTVWDAEKLPLTGPLPTTLPVWSLLVSNNRLRTRSFLQPAARILNVDQSTVTGNIIHNRPPPTATSAPTPWSFFLVPIKLPRTIGLFILVPAATAITGNVFLGQAALPERRDFLNLPWAQLNTIRFLF